MQNTLSVVIIGQSVRRRSAGLARISATTCKIASARVALSRARGTEPPPCARARLQAADGRWTVVWVAPLVGAAGGYVITLEAARSQDLAPLLMRAWSLTAREREVAQLVIDGLSSEDIAQALFISVHTARDHVKAIFGKTGVSRRQDLVAALTGNAYAR